MGVLLRRLRIAVFQISKTGTFCIFSFTYLRKVQFHGMPQIMFVWCTVHCSSIFFFLEMRLVKCLSRVSDAFRYAVWKVC